MRIVICLFVLVFASVSQAAHVAPEVKTAIKAYQDLLKGDFKGFRKQLDKPERKTLGTPEEQAKLRTALGNGALEQKWQSASQPVPIACFWHADCVRSKTFEQRFEFAINEVRAGGESKDQRGTLEVVCRTETFYTPGKVRTQTDGTECKVSSLELKP
jgi:hypothetical protein